MYIKASEPLVLPYAENEKEYISQGVEPCNAQKNGMVLSRQWRVTFAGNEIPVYAVPVTHGGPHSFAIIEATEKAVNLLIESTYPLRSAHIQDAFGILEHICSDHTIELTEVRNPSMIVVEANNHYRYPLSIFVVQPDEKPDPEDPNVIWFEPGIHRVRQLTLSSGQTVYLEKGALLLPEQPDETDKILIDSDWAGKPNYEDFFAAADQKDITICGYGMIDLTSLDWHARRTMVFTSCENVQIKNVLLNGAAHWTMVFFGCKDVHVDSVKIFGYRQNTDGIDIVDTHNAVIQNCFIRTGDDTICCKSMSLTPRLETKHIRVDGCMIWSDKVRCLGITGETKNDIYDVVFENCRIVHSFADWTREVGSLAIVVSDSGRIHDITFRNIHICQESNFVVVCMIIKDMWSTDDKAGHVDHIRFENIVIPKDSMMFFENYDEEHQIQNVTFSNIWEEKQGNALEVEKYKYIKQ